MKDKRRMFNIRLNKKRKRDADLIKVLDTAKRVSSITDYIRKASMVYENRLANTPETFCHRITDNE